MLYLLYRTGYFLANAIPIKVSYFIADRVARLFCAFGREDKAALRSNLRVVLGDDVDDKVLDRHVHAVFRNFARYLVDFFRFTRFTEDHIARHITLRGRENLDKALESGKGLILLSLHLGNWELGGAIIGGLNYPISAIILEQPDRKVNDFFVKQRAINGLRSIPLGISIKECYKVLKRNEILAIVGDKDYTNTGIPVEFFGRKAIMPKGAAAFALRTGAPIVFTVVTRMEGDKFCMFFEEPIYPESTGRDEDDVKALMTRYISKFESYIRSYPDQWYVFRKIWDV
ncbi:MAG: lysophospholipid acyltransferase family protein [Candidatus Omnitrophica bacterium]|nr:lysophospholipid acyltransferase family protein [Candidatus Omnitrophota bacterium]MDD5487359.1 lysophospholipid acyltransferase family protein [Candidatus Omnitrophota bacterium]